MSEPPFSRLATVYDAIMADVEYDAWIDFVLRHATRRGFSGGPILDLACGTGNATLPAHEQGFEVEGLDASPAMIDAARAKAPELRWTVADVRTFDLGRRFGLIYSVFDSLNNLESDDDFLRMARRVRDHLEPGGQFAFDCNTREGLRNLWDDGVAEGWADDVYYRWTHDYDEAREVARVRAYCRRGDEEFVEVHHERPYDPSDLRRLLGEAGFADVEVVRYPAADAAPEDEPRVWAFATAPDPRRQPGSSTPAASRNARATLLTSSSP